LVIADVDQHVPAPGDVAVHDVDAGTVVELGVLETVGRIELAVSAGRVVEQLGQDAHDVVVAVEDLVVIPGLTAVATHEDRLRIVHHDLPHVGMRSLFAQLAAVSPLSRASYVPHVRGHSHRPAVSRLDQSMPAYERYHRAESGDSVPSLANHLKPARDRSTGAPPLGRWPATDAPIWRGCRGSSHRCLARCSVLIVTGEDGRRCRQPAAWTARTWAC
jgi:hypothetical protein